MRCCIEALARRLATMTFGPEDTLGSLAAHLNEPIDRVQDALDVLKLLKRTGTLDGGPYTYIPVGAISTKGDHDQT